MPELPCADHVFSLTLFVIMREAVLSQHIVFVIATRHLLGTVCVTSGVRPSVYTSAL